MIILLLFPAIDSVELSLAMTKDLCLFVIAYRMVIGMIALEERRIHLLHWLYNIGGVTDDLYNIVPPSSGSVLSVIRDSDGWVCGQDFFGVKKSFPLDNLHSHQVPRKVIKDHVVSMKQRQSHLNRRRL